MSTTRGTVPCVYIYTFTYARLLKKIFSSALRALGLTFPHMCGPPRPISPTHLTPWAAQTLNASQSAYVCTICAKQFMLYALRIACQPLMIASQPLPQLHQSWGEGPGGNASQYSPMRLYLGLYYCLICQRKHIEAQKSIAATHVPLTTASQACPKLHPS